jgi:hypothetical protein
MSSIDLKPRDETPKSFFNPLAHDFIGEIRDDSNTIIKYTIPSMEISTFPAYIAERLIADLMTEITNQRELGYLTEEQKEKLRKEVEVNLNA